MRNLPGQEGQPPQGGLGDETIIVRRKPMSQERAAAYLADAIWRYADNVGLPEWRQWDGSSANPFLHLAERIYMEAVSELYPEAFGPEARP